MKKFMIFYMADPAAFETMMQSSTPETRKKGMEAWMRWMTAHKGSIVDGGAPLGKTRRVDAKGAKDVKNGIGGYSVVQADSHDAAAKMFSKDHPHLQMPGAWVEIVEIMPMPGM
jgi:YCII-related domain